MNQHLHSPTKLTEFARDFEDEPDTLFGRFVNKIQNAYNQSYNTVNDVPTSTHGQSSKSIFYADTKTESATTSKPATSTNITASSSRTLAPQVSSDHSTSSTTTSSSTADESSEKLGELPIEVNEGRTYVNVLKRISNIMATKNSDLRNYKDTDLQRFWMPDSKAKECYDCSQKFSTFRRKHHCRLCGQIFCSKCCNQVVPGKIIKCSGDLKVCNYCSKVVLSYLKSPNITVDLHSDLQALQQDLANKLEDKDDDSNSNILITRSTTPRKTSFGYQEERLATNQTNILSFDDRKNILQQSNSLITLHEEMQRLLPVQNCGADLIVFLVSNNKSSNKTQSLAILSAMLAAGFLQPIVPDSEQLEFDEQLHYKFVELSRQNSEEATFKEFVDISEAPNLQFEANSEPQPPKSIDASISFQSAQDIELENSIGSTATISKLLESYCDYEEQLLIQMLRTLNLDLCWAKVLNPLCCRAANQFKPEYCTNELMDIRNYVNFKKVPGGKRQECKIVGGVVFSKNVAHKDMATRVEHPRILLLQCPIVYERIEGKFVSISTVLLQEKEYLRNVCARIMSFKPNVVLVHKNVAGIAQDMLRSHNITLVLDVKLSVMERLARTLQCDVIASIESNITKPKLGLCDAFYIQSFSDGSGTSKTLMFFENLTSPRGYTCLLRGGNNKELALVKKVASFLVYARYNWRLEMSFLLDEFAEPLSPKPPIFDSKEPSPEDEIASMSNKDDEEPQLRSALPKLIIERKSEDRIFTVVTENVADFTDPLRSTEIVSKEASSDIAVVKLAVETRYDNRFRNALSSTLLSVSPFLTFPLPYLESEQGRKCKLRSLFPSELYFSKLWSVNSASISLDRTESNEIYKNSNETQLRPSHPFLKLKITTPIDNRNIQTLLAEFRAYGARYPKKKKKFKLLKRRESFQRPQKVSEDHVYKDALDLENHQHLPVLFCSFYYNPKAASSFCTPPILLDMKFYDQHDIMLAQFLHRYCSPLSSSICPRCNLPEMGHVRRYVHSMGSVQIFLTEENLKMAPNCIYFTAWCKKCNEVTPKVPLSESAKYLSFAKYLELRFHGHSYKKRPIEPNDDKNFSHDSRCQHSLHSDYVHYFSYRGVTAKFQYTPVEVWEIELPTLLINLLHPKAFNHFQILEEIKNFSLKGHEVYTRIHEKIADLAIEDETSPMVTILKTSLSKDQFKFKQQVEIVQTLLTDTRANSYDINDSLLMSKRILSESIVVWSPRLHDIATSQKLAAKQQHVDPGTICTEDLRSDHSDNSPTMPDTSRVPHVGIYFDNLSQLEDNNVSDTNTTASTSIEKKSSADQFVSSATTSDKKSIKQMIGQFLPSANHTTLLETPFTAQEHYTLPLGAFPIMVHDQDLSSVIAYALTSCDYQRFVTNSAGGENMTMDGNTYVTGNSSTTTYPSPSMKRKSQDSGAQPSNQELDENLKENISLKGSTLYSNTNSSTNNNDDDRKNTKSNNSHIELSFQDHSTQFTCKIYFAREFDLMRAKTLKPPKLGKSLYKELEQNKKREELKVSQSRSGPEMELVRKPSDTDSSSFKTQPETIANKDEKSLLQADIEESRNALARSLCRSIQWEARGGKSGSRFCKTSDDRFILKEMNKNDINIFENFAPNYFEYIAKCQQQNQPTLLAKIFGVFKVSVKNKDCFQEKALLVMENLFYDCDIKSKFDLKGSERNRHVDPSNRNGETVLLDENFVQMSWSKPLYVLSHSKWVLKDAINRDSSFLQKNQVMDYSLLVGLDDKNGLLVLGIIDYIRTFTLDKKFESIVKQTLVLGGMGKLPTIISPERYKQRFTDAMDRYFYTVPDRWEGLSKI